MTGDHTTDSEPVKDKIPTRASVPELRQSLEIANSLVRAGVAFICVPYFTQEQKQVAAGLASYNFEAIESAINDKA